MSKHRVIDTLFTCQSGLNGSILHAVVTHEEGQEPCVQLMRTFPVGDATSERKTKMFRLSLEETLMLADQFKTVDSDWPVSKGGEEQ